VKNTNLDPPLGNGILMVEYAPGPFAQSSAFIHLESNTVLAASSNGIEVDTRLSSGFVQDQTVIIDHNTVYGNGFNGHRVPNVVLTTRNPLSQYLRSNYKST